MANDAPKLRGYTFTKPPDKFEIWWDKIEEKLTLSDGSTRKYFKGFKLKFKFGWSNNWLSSEDYSALCVIYADQSALALYPRPDIYPTRTHNVLLTNDLDFKAWRDLMEGTGIQGYEGTIEGETTTVTSTITGW